MKSEEMDGEQVAIYQRYALVEYEKRVSFAKLNYESAQSYARWLFASLLAMNGAALVGIASTGKLAAQLFATTGLFFILGIASALIGGLYAWFNWDRAATRYRDMAEPKMLHGPDWSPEPLPETDAFLDSTRWKSIAAGLLSATFFTLGLFFIWVSIALDSLVTAEFVIGSEANNKPSDGGMGAAMTYQSWLEIAAAWSAIATFAIAVVAYGKYLTERCKNAGGSKSILRLKRLPVGIRANAHWFT